MPASTGAVAVLSAAQGPERSAAIPHFQLQDVDAHEDLGDLLGSERGAPAPELDPSIAEGGHPEAAVGSPTGRRRVSPIVPVAAALTLGLAAGFFLAPLLGAAPWIATATGGVAGVTAGGGWSLWRSSRN